MSYGLSCLWQITACCSLVLFSDHCLCCSFCQAFDNLQSCFFSCCCLCPSLCHACNNQHASAILLSSQATVYLFHNSLVKLCVKTHLNSVQSFICTLSVQWGLDLPWNYLFSCCNSMYSPNWIHKPSTIMITITTYDSIKNSTTSDLIFTFSVTTYQTFFGSLMVNFQYYMTGKWLP